jgi:competence protein ComEA
MPTPAERRALLFLTGVVCLGGAVRATRAVAAREPVPAAAERALEAQRAAVAAAREREGGRARGGRSAGGQPPRAGGRPTEPPAPRLAPRPAGGRPARARPPAVVRIVDVDRAPAAELEALPRVGPVLARRIVADRDSLGPFGSLEGLRRVKGIGPAMLRALEGHVTFSGTPRPTSDP